MHCVPKNPFYIKPQDARVHGLRLSRNFGQHLAIAAGLQASRGECVVVMDCDLQDPPEMIPILVRKAREGFDVVSTRRRSRSSSLFRRATSRLFYLLTRILSSPFVKPDSDTFSLISRKVVQAYLRTADAYSPYPFVVNWLGFRSADVELEQAERLTGDSSYTLSRLVSYALNSLVSQSTRLLHISTAIGLLFSTLAIGQILYVLYLKFSNFTGVLGWTSLMAAIWLVGGTILFSLGVIGLYLTRMFEQTRNRPLFIVSDHTDESDSHENRERSLTVP